MALQIVPPERTGLGDLTQAFLASWLPRQQLREKLILQQQMEEQQRQQATERTKQYVPQIFGVTPQALSQVQRPEMISPEKRYAVAKGLGGGTVPSKYLTTVSPQGLGNLPEGMKVNLESMGVPISYEKPRPDFLSQYLALQAKDGGLKGQENISTMIPEGENPEDFYLKPTITKTRGIPERIMVPERKEKLPSKELSDLKDLDVNTADLQANLNMLEKNPDIKKFIGPGIAQRPGAIADIITQLGGAPKEFATFKAASDLAFQKYRKWVTGVQAGYPELQWIAVDYPKPTDTSDIYISKANKAMEGMQRNRSIFLDYLSKNNYAVGKFKQKTQQPQQVDPLGLR